MLPMNSICTSISTTSESKHEPNITETNISTDGDVVEDSGEKEHSIKNTQELSEAYSSNDCTLIMIGSSFTFLFAVFLVPQINFTGQALSLFQSETKTNVPSDGPNTVYRLPAPAKQFFPQHSIVHDFYKGDLDTAIRLLKKHDIIFVMYYAHWSEASVMARDEFERASHYFISRVPFIAINCWRALSECRSKYRFYSFPSFYAYVDGVDKGFFFSGAEKSEYFVRFLESLLNPLTHIHNSTQLVNFVSDQDSSLVGYFNLSSTEPQSSYQQFYYASLRSIESNFIQPVRFGVLSDHKFASKYSIDHMKPLVLLRSVKDNLVYPSKNNFTSSMISRWVHDNMVQPLVKWHFPNGFKSTELYRVLQTGPTVILFTKFDACSTFNVYASLLREVALTYYACNSTAQIQNKLNTITESLSNSRRLPESSNNLCLKCAGDTGISSCNSCCYSMESDLTVCQVCPNSHGTCRGNCNMCHQVPLKLMRTIAVQRSCLSLPHKVYPTASSKVCCYTQSINRRFTDDYVKVHSRCFRGYKARVDVHHTVDNNTLCQMNASLNFLAVDSKIYHKYLVSLGIPMLENQMSLALIDLTNESHYLLKEEYTKENIVKFLSSYNSGDLERQLLSTRRVNKQLATPSQINVEDINHQQLNSIMLSKTQKDIVILFHAKWCIHCKAVYSKYLMTTHYFSKMTNIKFLRLDVSKNTLPWKYTVTHVPSIFIKPYSMDIEQLHVTENTSESAIARFVLQHCSWQHLAELVIRTKDIDELIHIIRSSVGELSHTLERLSTRKADTPAINRIILRNILSVRLRRLNLMKLLRMLRSPLLFKCNLCVSKILTKMKHYRRLVQM